MPTSHRAQTAIAVVLVALVLGPFVPSQLQAVTNPSSAQYNDNWWYEDGVLIINFKPETSKAAFVLGKSNVRTGLANVDVLFKNYQVSDFDKLFVGAEKPESASEVDLSNYYRVRFSKITSLDDAFSAFSKLPEVEHIEKVGIHPLMVTPNDPGYPSQWGLNQANDKDIDAPEAWDLEDGDTSILVGAMDTGVQWDHPDLAGASPFTNGNIWINWAEYNGVAGVDDDGNGYVDDFRGWDWVDGVSGWPGEDANTPDNNPMDFNGHGSHTAGIMAAITNNGTGGAGVAGGFLPSRGCRIMCLRIGWSENTGGQELGYVAMDFAAQAFYYAANMGVTSVNCSWGSSNSGGIGAAVNYATALGVVVCTAAGNSNNQVASYLAGRADVIAVASLTSSGVKSSFSSYGTWVDVSAPGSSIYSTYSVHGSPSYATLSGTSMASPHVAGLAGLIRSLSPTITRGALDTLIRNTTDNIYDLNPSYAGKLGTGRINARNALSQAFSVQVAATPRFGLSPLNVNFTGSSGAQIDSWYWTFGDGDNATSKDVSHLYSLPGRYDVSLTATGPQGTLVANLPQYVIAYADTLKMGDFNGNYLDPLVVDVNLTNFAPITTLRIPVNYGGNMDIRLDTISRVGTRGTAFESVQILASSGPSHQFVVQMITDNGGGSPPLAAGDGTLFRMYFHYNIQPPNPGVNTTDTTTLSGYSFLASTTFGNYAPVIKPGTINVMTGLQGDADANYLINISDAVYMIEFIFNNGPEPTLYNGDANSSGLLNISDAVYLIDYVFNGAPAELISG